MEKVKRFKKRIVSLFMALIMFFGCFGYALGQSDTANAATDNLAMKVNKNGDIVWSTVSHANPNSGKRFHTMNYILMEPETSKCGDEERKKQLDPTMTVTILVSVSIEIKQKKVKGAKTKRSIKNRIKRSVNFEGYLKIHTPFCCLISSFYWLSFQRRQLSQLSAARLPRCILPEAWRGSLFSFSPESEEDRGVRELR